MRSHCEDPNDTLAFIKGNASRITTVSLDWVNVAETAFNAMSLNNGVQDGDASNARILTQFMLEKGELNPSLPSPAEALAVMAGSTLLMSAQDSPFYEYFVSSTRQLLSPLTATELLLHDPRSPTNPSFQRQHTSPAVRIWRHRALPTWFPHRPHSGFFHERIRVNILHR
jgi:hypothetical protein